jgi:DALR anticodon binding domain
VQRWIGTPSHTAARFDRARRLYVGRPVVEHHADAFSLGIIVPCGLAGRARPYLRFIIFDDPQMTMARLALVQGVFTVLASGLELLGVEAPYQMR